MQALFARDRDLALAPAAIAPAEERHFQRLWQGIPGIAEDSAGVSWACFYSGGSDEGPDNYVVLYRQSARDGSWGQEAYVIDPPGGVRAYDPCLWTDPIGRLWVFWAQSHGWYDGRMGVWASHLDDPASPGVWSAPVRIADGLMMNKPIVAQDGRWLLPIGLWASRKSEVAFKSDRRLSSVYASTDDGSSFVYLGGSNIYDRYFDEHMVVERLDGALDMYVRVRHGVGRARSLDGGRTWHTDAAVAFPGPNSRFHIRRLASGRLLLINHVDFTGRNNLAALLSDDDGLSWSHRLLLDERPGISYPDAIEFRAGAIRFVYDRDRYGAGEVLVNEVTENDILRGGTEPWQLVRPPEVVSSRADFPAQRPLEGSGDPVHEHG